MRPSALNPLFAPAQSLAGIGPRLAVLLKKCLALPAGVSGPRVIDLLWHLPTGVIDRRAEPSIADAVPGSIVTLKVRVLKHKAAPPRSSKAPYKVACEDDTGRIDLVFFHVERAFVERQLPQGEIRYVSGRIERYGETLQMTHPDYIVTEEARGELPMIEPVYPLTAGLSGKVLAKASRQAVDRVPDMPEWQNDAWLKQRDWPDLKSALRRLHLPDAIDDVSTGVAPWRRLAYDELLAGQLALGLVRQNFKAQRGRAALGQRVHSRPHRRCLAVRLDERATRGAQRHRRRYRGASQDDATVAGRCRLRENCCRADDDGDCRRGEGAGGADGADEVLARQHFDTIAPLAERGRPARRLLLTGREKGKSRDAILQRLADGEIDILIGTHALFQDDVAFKDLAVAVIDEQHRFGVHQRMALQAKGGRRRRNMLVMTATPIPRTLLMTHYGDLDVSKLTEKPAGRKPIVTKMAPLEALEKLIARLRAQLADGAQVYWVCPLIESSAETDLAAAEERCAHLRQTFGEDVGLLHGGLSPKEKDRVMAAFAAGRLKILVATTVIEVGVDVPNANIMVVEHAERFGLAQLHQLRGRVGRGSRESFCMLLYKAPLGETAEARLKMMEETEDGFKIAEKDLELRGGGEMLGARQSGAPAFRVAEVPGFEELLASRARRRDNDPLRRSRPCDAARRGAAHAALSL